MTRFFSLENESENNTVKNGSSATVEISDEELASVAGGYMLAGPAGELDWWKRQMYYKQHPGMMQSLVTAQ